jgi:arginase family enzyme
MATTAVFFPFDLFGSAGTSAGADLLAEAFREMLADNRREKVPTRAQAYSDQVRFRRYEFNTLGDLQDWQEQARREARRAWQRGDFLMWMTGNHLGALPIYQELAASVSDTLVVQFDAHLDIQHFAECTQEPSHGNFLLHSDQPLPAVINIGHRDLLMRADYIRQHYRSVFSAAEMAIDPEPAWKEVQTAAGEATRILIDIDCDVLDPAFFPAVTNPLPIGLSPQVLLRFIEAAWSGKMAGVILSEFEPARDRRDQSLAFLLWLLEYLLLKRYEPAALLGERSRFC